MSRAIYITFDKLDPNSGAGLVCLHEINALKRVVDNLIVIERKDIIGADQYEFNPFFYDYFASLVLPLDLFDILHLSCSPANAILQKVRVHHYVVNIVAHDLQVSIDEHELYYGKGSYPFKHNTNEYLHSLLLKHAENADTILTPSSSSARWIISNLKNHNVAVIPHGTEIPEKVEPLPEKLSFGYMGAFGPDKGLIYLFDAWNRRQTSNDLLVFAGSCCNAIQAAGSIKILGWVKHISEFYNQISVYIQPCYSSDTRLFTNEGFKTISEVKKGDLVWTMTENMHIELNPIEEIYQQHYNGDMVKILNKQVDLLVTPNHRIYFRYNTCVNRLQVKEASQILAERVRHFIPTTGVWNGREDESIDLKELIDSTYCDSKIVNTNTLFELIGWYIAEGNQDGMYTCISNTSATNINKICTLLLDLNIEYTKKYKSDGECTIYFNNWSLFKILQECGIGAKNKTIPEWCLTFSPSVLKHLYDSLMLGDGTRGGHQVAYYTSSDKLMHKFCELSIKLGFSPTFFLRTSVEHEIKATGQVIKEGTGWCINIREQKHEGSVQFDNPRLEHYGGETWCVSTKNKNLFVERNGLITLCGNSVTEGFGIEIIEAMAYGRPVIVSSGAGGADAVRDGVDGFVVPPKDPNAILAKMKWFNDNPQAVIEMGCNAREASLQYSWDKIENRYVEFYTKVGRLDECLIA